jgi:hypothetical protein
MSEITVEELDEYEHIYNEATDLEKRYQFTWFDLEDDNGEYIARVPVRN